MSTRLYTDEELDGLRSIPKRVSNPGARWSPKPKVKPGHRQRRYQAAGDADEETRFSIYQRENLNDAGDFSCGIAFLPPGGPPLTLARYNGPSHEHGDISYHAHIHRATERAMATGRKPESVAEETDRFETLEGAMACLVEDFNLTGIRAQHDRPRLIP